MSTYQIESKAGVIYGQYEGDSPRAAFLAMLADSGDSRSYGEPHVGTEDDWIIVPVEPA